MLLLLFKICVVIRNFSYLIIITNKDTLITQNRIKKNCSLGQAEAKYYKDLEIHSLYVALFFVLCMLVGAAIL